MDFVAMIVCGALLWVYLSGLRSPESSLDSPEDPAVKGWIVSPLNLHIEALSPKTSEWGPYLETE